MLLVGTDSYVTLTEAETYISSYFTDTNPIKIMWDGLSDANKEVCLRRGFRCIEQLPLSGSKYCYGQLTQFPRYPQPDVPEAVKNAQVELALAAGQVEMKINVDPDIEIRTSLRQQGVTDIRIGKLSESYESSLPLIEQFPLYMQVSSEARNYLKPWMGGGYDVHTSFEPIGLLSAFNWDGLTWRY